MDIFNSSYYGLNRILLSIVGHWPYQNSKIRQIQKVIVLLVLMTCAYMQIMNLLVSERSIDLIIGSFPTLIITIDSMVLFYKYHFSSDHIKLLLEIMKNDWNSRKSKREIEIMQSYAERGEMFSLVYTCYVYIAVFIMLLSSLVPVILDIAVPLNESRLRQSPFPGNYLFLNVQENFYTIFIHMALCAFVIVTLLTASDIMFLAYMQHACSNFAIFGDRLKQTFCMNNFLATQQLKHENSMIYRNIVVCIEEHKKAIKFATYIENFYTWCLFIQIGLNMICMSFTLTKVTLWLGNEDDLFMTVIWIVGQFIHIFVISFPGQKLWDHSQEIFTKIYISKWYNTTVQSQKLLIFILRRCTEPCFITVGKMYVLSLESYLKVIQTSLSYCMVLSSLR